MDVHLRDLRYFVAVADDLHFTRAAERLFIAQPALSKQIRALERRLGFPLFVRGTRGVALTEQGATLLPAAREVLERWGVGLDDARAAVPAGTLVVGMQTAVGRELQADALRRFRERMPGWTVSLRLVGWADPTAGLADGTSDVAFLWLPAAAGLRTRVLARERLWVALPSEHRLRDRDEISFEELSGEPFIALPVNAGPLRAFWLGADARGGREPIVAAEATSADEVFEAIASGLGVALLAEGNVDLYPRPGVVCRALNGLPPAELAVAWRATDRRRVLTTFLACLPER